MTSEPSNFRIWFTTLIYDVAVEFLYGRCLHRSNIELPSFNLMLCFKTVTFFAGGRLTLLLVSGTTLKVVKFETSCIVILSSKVSFIYLSLQIIQSWEEALINPSEKHKRHEAKFGIKAISFHNTLKRPPLLIQKRKR